jgi:hypothetical protein
MAVDGVLVYYFQTVLCSVVQKLTSVLHSKQWGEESHSIAIRVSSNTLFVRGKMPSPQTRQTSAMLHPSGYTNGL